MNIIPNIITPEWLINHPKYVFVFGDNTIHCGIGGAAICRNCFNTYGFITKKYPDNKDSSFYTCDEYDNIFKNELKKLKLFIDARPYKIFIISKIGGGLANRYNIFENIIEPAIMRTFKQYKNVVFMF